MRKRKQRGQIKPTMTKEQMQEFISAGIEASKNDLRLPGVEPIAPTPAQLLARKAYRDGSLRFETHKRTREGHAILGHEFDRIIKERKAETLARDFKDKIEDRRGHDRGHEPLTGVLAGK